MKYYGYILSLVFLFSLPYSKSLAQNKYIITTVAGNGVAGYSGDGGLAVDAELTGPKTVALDSDNNIYIGDGANVIREVYAKTGKIATIAGTGTLGFSGDGGPAIDATMSYPSVLYADTRGNIYLSDDFRIRKIDDAGKIYTVAGNGHKGFSSDGGLADTTMINGCNALIVDDTGNIIFCDFSNHRIRKVNNITGIISTIAGTGSAVISGDGGPAISAGIVDPEGLCIDKHNDLYVSSFANGNIRKINLTTGIITLYAGGGTGYSGDGGPAIGAGISIAYGLVCDAMGNLYFSDEAHQVIRRIDAITGIINTIAGAKYGNTTSSGGYSGDGGDANSAQLYNPSGIAMDASGDIYFADNGNSCIRKLSIATGVSNLFLENVLDIYPDPANDYIKLDIEHAKAAYVYSAAGMAVSKTENINASTNSLDVSKLSEGVYIVTVIYNDGSKKTGRFIKR